MVSRGWDIGATLLMAPPQTQLDRPIPWAIQQRATCIRTKLHTNIHSGSTLMRLDRRKESGWEDTVLMISVQNLYKSSALSVRKKDLNSKGK